MKLREVSGFRLMLVATILIGGFGLLGAQFAGGNGTEADPWQIETAEHLDNVRNYLGAEHRDKHFIQTANIDLTAATGEGGEYWNEGEGWVPIGDIDNRFRGYYEGNGFVINGIYINRPEIRYQSLFGVTDEATVLNLSVTNVDIQGRTYTGSLVGSVRNTTISNCFSTGSVAGDMNVGGLVGSATGYSGNISAISNSYSTVSVAGAAIVGGLVGWAMISVSISNSYSTGSVQGESSMVGGLVGWAMDGIIISNSYSTGSVTGRESVGGLVGRVSTRSTISNSYSTGSVTGEENLGGLLGLSIFQVTVSNSYSTGSVTGEENLGGLLGAYENNIPDIINSYWDMQSSGMETSVGGYGRTNEQMTYPYDENTYVNWDFEEVWFADTSGIVNGGYPNLKWQTVPHPDVVINPYPVNDTLNVSVDLDFLRWDYVDNYPYTTPAGFRIYFNDTGQFGEDNNFEWVPYVEDQVEYGTGSILPEGLEYRNVYYWKVLPTTRENGTGEGEDARDVPVWTFKTERCPNPLTAVNPLPVNDTTDVSVALESLRWSYLVDSTYANPVGFRVFFSDTGNFEEDDEFDWVLYVEEQVTYSSSDILPTEKLDYHTVYYWKVVPTTIAPNERGEDRQRRFDKDRRLKSPPTRGDAENVPVWTFRTEEEATSVELPEHQYATELRHNYPNPFNPETAIKFNIKQETDATLSIYNIKGQIVKNLHTGSIRAGEHRLVWNGKDDNGREVGSGVYFYRLKTDHYDQVNKMLLVR